MKKQLILLPAFCLILSACDNSINVMKPEDGKNHSASTVGENEADKAITHKIRQNLMDDNALSTQAKDVKILTINGVVTLRGVVRSEAEKTEVESKAKAVADVKSVDNQLEIVTTEAS